MRSARNPAMPQRYRPIVTAGAAAGRALAAAIPPEVVAVLVGSRIALTIVGVLSVSLLTGPETVLLVWTGFTPLDVWLRWDAPFYVQIATSGYNPDSPLPNIVFFPLYPALIRVVSALGGGGSLAMWIAALLIALGSLVAAVGYLIALARIDLGDLVARRAATYLLIFPTTLFLSAGYPEALFLALTLACFYYARRGRWWLVGLLGLAASLTRPYGALLVIPLAFEYLLQRRFDLRRVRRDSLWLGLVPLGLPIFLGYIAWTFGPGAMAAAQHTWGRGFVPPWVIVGRLFEGPVVVHGLTLGISLVDLAFAAFFAIIVLMSWWRLRPTYALHATLLLAAFLSSGQFSSVPRYGLAIFPVFLVLGLLADRGSRHQAILSISVILAGFAMALVNAGVWVA